MLCNTTELTLVDFFLAQEQTLMLKMTMACKLPILNRAYKRITLHGNNFQDELSFI